MLKGYKIRIYPTKEQEHLIWMHIGACRFVWNYMLNEQNRRHDNHERTLTGIDMMNKLTELKQQKEFLWMKDISNASLQRTCADLWTNYQTFFKGNCKHPIFKSKKNIRQQFPVRTDRFYFIGNHVHIQKIGKIKYKTDFTLPIGRDKKFQNVHVSYINGKYMLSFSISCENQTVETNDYCMGIDLGVKKLAVVAYGDNKLTYDNINKSQKIKKLHRKIARLHRSITRKSIESVKKNGHYVESKNIQKEIIQLRKANARITNINMDYIHKITRFLVELKPNCVAMEDLSVEAMLKTRWLRKQVKEQRFALFISTMQYKCKNRGIRFVQADRYYPSSKICSNCGEKKEDLKLCNRTYVCGCCGLIIDRDYNAARNLMKYAIQNQEVQL